MFRVGLVGAGYVSRFHIMALRRLKNVRLVGITDLDLLLARKTGLPVYATLEEMAAAGLDVVHVLTPPDAHAATALRALALGCHVLVEKPLATSLEDCDRLEAAARSRGLSLCVNHSLLGDPLMRRAVALVRDGKIGELVAVDDRWSSEYPPYSGGPPPPHHLDGGYPFRDLGVHVLYVVRELLGDILDVQAISWSSGLKEGDPNLHFDEWSVFVRCAGGTGTARLSWNAKPLQHQVLILGTRGTLHLDLFSMFLTRRRATPLPKALERVANTFAESISSSLQITVNAARFMAGNLRPYQGLHNFVSSFYEALTNGQPMPAGVGQARDIVRWTEQTARKADEARTQLRSRFQSSGGSRVVVTGANGLVGRALVRRLLQNGELVRLFVRRLPPPEIVDHPQVQVVLGDLGDPRAVDGALAEATVVFHLGAALTGGWEAHEAGTIVGTRNVVEACLKHDVPRLIHVSSLSVVDCAGIPAGQAVNEDSPLEPSPHRRGFYTRAKLAAERIVSAAVKERRLRAVVIRPGRIWSEESAALSAAVGVRVGGWLVVVGDATQRLPLIHVEDVVEGLIMARHGQHADGRVYQLVDDEAPSREETAVLHARGRDPNLAVAHVPMTLACFIAHGCELLWTVIGRHPPVSSYRVRSAYAPLTFDSRRAREELGWQPRVKSGAALRALFPAAGAHGPTAGVGERA